MLRIKTPNQPLEQPQIMGVLNITPDSFSDGGCYNTPKQAIAQALKMVNEGVDIIDIGGESSRPWAKPVALAQELERTIPIIQALATRIEISISIDTTKPQVMVEALKAGANLVNDIDALSALFVDKKSLAFVLNSGCNICLMHKQGKPQNMQNKPTYQDIIVELTIFFQQKIKQCMAVGIDKNRLILDLGFGFGKTLTHNLTLLNNLNKFKQFGLPLLAGVSKKSMIDIMLGGNTQPSERIIGSITAALIALNQGANIIRTHNVAQTKEALTVWYHNKQFKLTHNNH